MAADLPENVHAHLLKAGSESWQATMSQGQQVSQLANGVLQAAMARNFDELGVAESRANSGMVATPVASPTTQAG